MPAMQGDDRLDMGNREGHGFRAPDEDPHLSNEFAA